MKLSVSSFYGFLILFIDIWWDLLGKTSAEPKARIYTQQHQHSQSYSSHIPIHNCSPVSRTELCAVRCVGSRIVDRALVSDRPVHRFDFPSYRQMQVSVPFVNDYALRLAAVTVEEVRCVRYGS